eukprot:GHUV01018641.1.p1 GENE.GHUV01018641.1~~GHUV01018641.1.p1  ORF type:complete len:223 (+),score=27.89 GHUV01018641.1:790-1458(+)
MWYSSLLEAWHGTDLYAVVYSQSAAPLVNCFGLQAGDLLSRLLGMWWPGSDTRPLVAAAVAAWAGPANHLLAHWFVQTGSYQLSCKLQRRPFKEALSRLVHHLKPTGWHPEAAVWPCIVAVRLLEYTAARTSLMISSVPMQQDSCLDKPVATMRGLSQERCTVDDVCVLQIEAAAAVRTATLHAGGECAWEHRPSRQGKEFVAGLPGLYQIGKVVGAELARH